MGFERAFMPFGSLAHQAIAYRADFEPCGWPHPFFRPLARSSLSTRLLSTQSPAHASRALRTSNVEETS